MSSARFANAQSVPRLASLLALTACLTLAGCAALTPTASDGPGSFAATGELRGSLHGGNQPVSGASVMLYAVGTAGYGVGSVLYATTTSANDGTGSFGFLKTGSGNSAPLTNVYGCPASGDPQMYLIASGGNTQGSGAGSNSAAVFLAPLGKCSGIGGGTFVDMNEVTTVGTLAALQQYFNPVTETLGYPNTTQAGVGFANAVSTIANLVNTSIGTAVTSTVLTATPAGSTLSASVTAVPEIAKINTLANITAACVNTVHSAANPSAACTTLFANAYPPFAATTSQPSVTFGTPADVLQATYDLLTNPGSESTQGTNNPAAMNALFGLTVASPPFLPALGSAPTDWTVGIRYTSTSACTYGTLLVAAYQLQADAAGNIWIASGGTSTATSNLVELTANGTPATCALGTSVALTKGLTIDTGGNVWIAGNSANAPFFKYSPVTSTYVSFPVPAGAVPYVPAADGFGNIFYTDATNKQVSQFPAGASAAAPVTALPLATVASFPFFIAVDTMGAAYVPNNSTTTSIYDIYPNTGTGNVNGYSAANVGSSTYVYNPYAIAAGLSGSINLANGASSTSTVAQTAYSFLPSGTGTATYTANSAQNAGGLNSARGPNAVDGAGNVWFANAVAQTGSYVTGATTSGLFSVSEFASTGVPLSPNTTAGGFQKDSTILASAPRSLTIDPSGNVWGGSNVSTGQGVFEIVGAAVPVVTPISRSLATGFAAGTRDAVSKP